MSYPQIYKASLEEAESRNETELFHASHKINIACREAVETAIRDNYDGKHLNRDCFRPVMEEYGAGRLEWVLANTLQQKNYDGRFSHNNRDWAATIRIPESRANGIDLRRRFMVDSHPALLDGFVNLVRRELAAREMQEYGGQKPSIKGQLSAPSLSGTSPVERKPDREVR